MYEIDCETYLVTVVTIVLAHSEKKLFLSSNNCKYHNRLNKCCTQIFKKKKIPEITKQKSSNN